MSKLVCDCRHILVDQTDSLSYKARFVRDQDRENYSGYIKDIANFIEAIKVGKRNEFIKNYFSGNYLNDLDDESVISVIITKYEVAYEGNIYQCDDCGRILIQIDGKNQYASFKLDDEDNTDIKWKEIFKRI